MSSAFWPGRPQFCLFCHVAPWRKKRAQPWLSRSPTPTSLPRPGMCPIDRTHAAICLPQPRRRVWVTEWTIHLWFASGDARFCARLLPQTLILQELLCFLCIKGQGLSLSFGDVTFSHLFYFWSYEKRQAQLFSAVLSPVRGISGHNLSRPQHHNSTVVVTADDWQRECLCLYRCILAYERRVGFVALLHFLDSFYFF